MRRPDKPHITFSHGLWWILGGDYSYGPCHWHELAGAHPFYCRDLRR